MVQLEPDRSPTNLSGSVWRSEERRAGGDFAPKMPPKLLAPVVAVVVASIKLWRPSSSLLPDSLDVWFGTFATLVWAGGRPGSCMTICPPGAGGSTILAPPLRSSEIVQAEPDRSPTNLSGSVW